MPECMAAAAKATLGARIEQQVALHVCACVGARVRVACVCACTRQLLQLLLRYSPPSEQPVMSTTRFMVPGQLVTTPTPAGD